MEKHLDINDYTQMKSEMICSILEKANTWRKNL